MFGDAFPLFQSYILPSLPFRRRHSSTTSTGTTASSTSSNGRPPSSAADYLTGATSTIACSRCHAELALTSQIISKGFTGRHGRAYLVAPPVPLSSFAAALAVAAPDPAAVPEQSQTGAEYSRSPTALPNTHAHRPVPRHLVTGLHTVRDVSCSSCGNVLGWQYVNAEEETQRYKVGKFILESRRTVVGGCWEGEGWGGAPRHDDGLGDGCESDNGFDSQDEDECEDLFGGVWSPQLAKQRRATRVGR